MKKIIALLPFLWSAALCAQLPVACGGGAASAVGCDLACISCNFNGFVGSSFGFPSGTAPGFCGTIENQQWLGFIAGENAASFSVTPKNCLFGNGLQIALYQQCDEAPIACDPGKPNGAGQTVTVNVALVPGSTYFLLVDGYAGDLCEFDVTISPPNAVYEPQLGLPGQINGPTEMCPGATFNYTVQPAAGAGGYIWDGPPGSLVNGEPVPVTVPAPQGLSVQFTLGDVGGAICVRAANACSANPGCPSQLFVTALDDSYRPQFAGGLSESLTCSGEPLELKPQIMPPGAYTYAWTSDSTGKVVGPMDQARLKVTAAAAYALTVSNPTNGCSNTDTVRVSLPLLPDSLTLKLQHVACYGYDNGYIRIEQIHKGKEPFRFALDGGEWGASTEFRYLPPGPHLVSIMAADACRYDTIVSIDEPDELLLYLGPDLTIHLGESLPLWSPNMTNYPERIERVVASDSSLDEWICEGCLYLPDWSFRYSLTVLDSNGCWASDDRLVTVTRGRRVFAPNIFAPQSRDGNERFALFGGPDVAEIALLRVFNRWGTLVFENRNFAPNDWSEGWDGNLRGRPAEPSVYIWHAE
ncbi:MAG: hypothetical protein ACK4NS_13315, partial [Saprospiraceae bacterium]